MFKLIITGIASFLALAGDGVLKGLQNLFPDKFNATATHDEMEDLAKIVADVKAAIAKGEEDEILGQYYGLKILLGKK